MSEPTEIELGGSGHVADPPILDELVESTGADRFSVVFVPDDRVSAREKETVGIRRNSPEERAIAACLAEIAATLGLAGSVIRITHGGGGSFSFVSVTGQRIALDDPGLSQDQTHRVCDLLQSISMQAQTAFLIEERQSGRRASA